MASRRETAPPLSCPASSFLLNPPPSPWVSSARSGPPLADATRASASAISSPSKLEREHYLRQNRDISRLCSIKSAQIRQFEAKLSKLERENLGMRIALREAENGLAARDRAQAARLSSSSTSTNLSDSQDADAQGREAEVVIPKPAQVTQGRQTSDAILLGENESVEDDSSSSSDDTRRRKRRRLSRRASPFGPKTILLSKLNQVQVIYQREHQALCTMMASFKSTSRFYKDLLQQLEEHALYTSKGSVSETLGEHSLEIRESASPQHSQHHQPREPELSTEILQSPHCSPPERQLSGGSSESLSKGAFENRPRQASSTPSPSPFFEPTRFLRKRTRQPKANQKPRSPGTRLEDSVMYSHKSSDPAREAMVPPSEKPRQDSDESEENQAAAPRVPRPPSRIAFNTSALSDIAENGALELVKTTSGTQDNFTILRSQLSMSTEFLESTTPRDVIMGEPESDRSDRSDAQESIARKLKPDPFNAGVHKAKNNILGSSTKRMENNRRISNSWATRDPEGERAKSIALSKALLAKFSRSSAPSDGPDDSNAPEQSQTASMQAATASRDSDVHGVNLDLDSSHEDVSGSALQGEETADTLGQAPTLEDIPKTGTTIPSPRHTNVNRRPIIARRRGFLRATPSPLVKSRSAIKAQHLKVMTPAQLLRRMNKTLFGTSKAPALPKSIIQSAEYTSISSTKAPSSLSNPSPSTQDNDTPIGSAKIERDSQTSEDTLSAKKLMPPPPTPAPKLTKKYRYRLASVNGQGPARSTGGSGEKGSVPIGDRDGDRERVGAPSIAYNLPSLRGVLYQGDPGTYSIRTPRRPATKSSHKTFSTKSVTRRNADLQ
ncbi:hypothetical protein BGZ72_005023 [Mortierella alpina]|nr:hypothetical protein BGZ72_005023 [Mortierella alpina]